QNEAGCVEEHPRGGPVAVERVARDGVADLGELHPELVRAPRERAEGDQRAVAASLERAELGDGLFAARGDADDAAAAVGELVTERPRAPGVAEHAGDVLFVHAPRLERPRDGARGPAAREEQQPARLAIEPLMDA